MTNKTYRNTVFTQALKRYTAPREVKSIAYTGKAYAFFNCNRKVEDIEAELPTIRRLVKTPKNLELTLIDGTENLKGDKELMALANEARSQGIRYLLQAKAPKLDNKHTAYALTRILNQAYQSPLYEDREAFSGAVVYRDRSKYKFME
jgi:hypothetical protein